MAASGDIRIDEIMPKLLCANWERIPFEAALLPNGSSYAKLKQKETSVKGKFPVIDQGEAFISGYTDDERNLYTGSLPVIIFGDHTRRVKYVDFQFAVGADGTKLLHPVRAFMPKFFYYYLTCLNLESQGYSRHYKFLREIEVPLPPLNEQRRIVAKLEKLLHKVDACKERLDKIPAILKRFRRSVLAAACSGRLTADWREKSTFESNGLPDGWKTVSSGNLFSFVTSGSRGWAKYYSGKGPLFLRIGNLDHDTIQLDLRSIQRVQPPKRTEGVRTRVQQNDILISITADVGMIALVPAGIEEAYINQHIALARPISGYSQKYLAWYLASSEGGLKQFQEMQRGATKVGLGLDDIKNVEIPLPPLPEQEEIVRRVEALFKKADEIEARYKKAKAFVDKLTQSILARAFRGELVPQDPNDAGVGAIRTYTGGEKV